MAELVRPAEALIGLEGRTAAELGGEWSALERSAIGKEAEPAEHFLGDGALPLREGPGAMLANDALRAEGLGAETSVLERAGGDAGSLQEDLVTVEAVANKYAIGLEGVELEVVGTFHPNLLTQGTTDAAGKIRLFTPAFESEEALARTLFHERTHVWQVRTYGMTYLKNVLELEDITYAADQDFWEAMLGQGGL